MCGSKLVEIAQTHLDKYNGGRRTRAGPVQVKGVGAFYEIRGTVGRYLPHQIELLDKSLSKNKNTGLLVENELLNEMCSSIFKMCEHI